MPTRERFIDGLWFGLIASLVLHALAVPAVMRLGEQPRSNPGDSPPASEPPPTEDQIQLGVERSDHATINWIGFADPTPHKAMPSETEQAALSMAPVGDPSEAPQAPTPIEPVEQTTQPVEPTESNAEAEPAPEQPEPSPRRADTPAPTTDDPWRASDPERVQTEFLPPPSAEKTETEPEPKQPEPTQNPQQPAAPSADGGPSGADDLPGLPSDKESPPTAREMALSLSDWGKPAAGEGIEVTPRRPRWGPTIYSLAWPRNPSVIIEFGRDGHVRRATFATRDGKPVNTGSAEVDRVLLNTLYNWTAKGKKIEALTEKGPGSRLAIRMDIRLRW